MELTITEDERQTLLYALEILGERAQSDYDMSATDNEITETAKKLTTINMLAIKIEGV